MKKILAVKTFGNHTNNLYQFTQLYCIARENNLNLSYLQFYKIKKFYNINYSNKSNLTIDIFYRILHYIFNFLAKIKIIKIYNLSLPEKCNKFITDICNKRKILFFTTGWSHNNNTILYQGQDLEVKYKDEIISLFRNDCPEIIKKYFPDKDKITIGLHIRRGDYKYYEDGKYYYSNEVYQNAVKSFTDNINLKDFNIIIFTNDKDLDKEFYLKNFKNCFFSNEEFQIDYELMKNCNYLIGAPSSFTMWASYLGNVPLYHIKEKNQAVTRECFKICDGFTN